MPHSFAPYLPGLVEVTRIKPINAEFTQITLFDDCLEALATHGLDQRIKLLIPSTQPPSSVSLTTIGDGWYSNWQKLSDQEREPLRTYTILNPSFKDRSLDVLIVHHEPLGVVGQWLANLSLGDRLVVVFPNRYSPDSEIGIDFRPGAAREFLLLGDETALPAIAAIIESLPKSATGIAAIETSLDNDELIPSHPGIQTVQLIRSSGAEHGEKLIPWLKEHLSHDEVNFESAKADELIWDSPPATKRSQYLWCAAETSVVKTIRGMVRESGSWSKNDCAFMGYWRKGRSE